MSIYSVVHNKKTATNRMSI